jgi:hypothetical protein
MWAAHKCFMLTDQCFPPVLPANGEDDCFAIVQIENGSLTELVGAFLDLVTGYDLPVGSVVVLSSALLLRVGPAAYAEELVCAFTRVREAYAGSVRAVHGFPIPQQGSHSEVLVRSLLDIEHWLAEIDKKSTNSLPSTSAFFIANWLKVSDQGDDSLSTKRAHSTYGTARIPYSMPHSFFSLVVAFSAWSPRYCKPSQLLASMLSVCPSGMELQPVFQYLFLQRLPQTLRTLLGEQECGDIRALAASHKTQPHEVMAVQEPVGGSGSKPQVAAVQPKKKQFKKKTGGSGGGGGSGGNSGVLNHAEQARVGSGLCFNHFVWGAKVKNCVKPCNWSGN